MRPDSHSFGAVADSRGAHMRASRARSGALGVHAQRLGGGGGGGRGEARLT